MNNRLRRGSRGGGHHHDGEALESRFALRVAARLSEQADAVPHDVSERLRVAREKALERARATGVAAAVPLPARAAAPVRMLAGAGRGVAGDGSPSPWWLRLASALPLVALVGGLVLIQQQHLHQQIAAAAEIDTDLLTDVLPPAAYGDAGFVEFLKAPQN